jgi:hypothetical protein
METAQAQEPKLSGRTRALEEARRRFLSRERIEVGAIARELRVDRATLYRWFGGRDQLIGELFWELTVDTFAWAERRASGSGIDRIVEVLRLHITAVAERPRHASCSPSAATCGRA